MRFHDTRYLDDGRGFNQGQPVRAIEIEDPADYDAIFERILATNFYGGGYLERHSGHVDERMSAHLWWVAEVLAHFRPRRVLELGCGRGDVLRVLQEAHGIEVAGIDMSSDAAELMWPSIRSGLTVGALEDVLMHWEGQSFDLVCGFDIWEHIHPAALDRAIRAAVEIGTRDCWYVFVVPAFGDDPVFGERFVLELEENREAYEQRTPFRFLIPDDADPAVPAAGHLTWAHTDWWVERFEAGGLERAPEVERELHQLLDPMVPESVRAMYVFRRRGSTAPAPVLGRPTLAFFRGLARRARFSSRSGATFTFSIGVDLVRWRDRGASRIESLLLDVPVRTLPLGRRLLRLVGSR